MKYSYINLSLLCFIDVCLASLQKCFLSFSIEFSMWMSQRLRARAIQNDGNGLSLLYFDTRLTQQELRLFRLSIFFLQFQFHPPFHINNSSFVWSTPFTFYKNLSTNQIWRFTRSDNVEKLNNTETQQNERTNKRK